MATLIFSIHFHPLSSHMALHHLIYLSTPTVPFSQDELKELLTECRIGNQMRNVTGLLLYGENHFLQLIEGEKAVVEDLYLKLQSDVRHYNLIKVADKPIAARAFKDWEMAFRCLDSKPNEGFQALESLDVNLEQLSSADALLIDLLRKQILSE